MRSLLTAVCFVGAGVLAACDTGNDDLASGGDATIADAASDATRASDAIDARDAAPDAPASDAGVDAPPPPPDAGRSVLEHHNHASRDGLYVDSRITKAAAKAMHLDASFQGAIQGVVLAQPLYVESGVGGAGTLYVVTEQNNVYALDASSGATLWQKRVAPPVPLASLPCGYLDPLGISGTPVIDFASRTLVFDAMTTPDGGTTKQHLVFALSIDDGATRAGWPVDIGATVTSAGAAFPSTFQMQRGALGLVDGVVYIPYGGHTGDCGDYHGWIVAVPLADPQHPSGWATIGNGGGIWGMGGVTSDGTSVFTSTGNTRGGATWNGGEAIVRLSKGAAFSGQIDDFFAPDDWAALDGADLDLSGSATILLDVPGASPSKLVAAFGKNGLGYFRDRTSLGGVDDAGLRVDVSDNAIVNAPAAYRTALGVYIALAAYGKNCPAGTSGDLTALRVHAGAPPTIETAWCARINGFGSPIVTTTDGTSDAIVWATGAGEIMQLHARDGDTGETIFDGAASDVMGNIAPRTSPIVVDGRIIVAGDDRVYAFTPAP